MDRVSADPEQDPGLHSQHCQKKMKTGPPRWLFWTKAAIGSQKKVEHQEPALEVSKCNPEWCGEAGELEGLVRSSCACLRGWRSPVG
ncbi:hypothetical protein LEMLEM_LOCUS9132, partial [Lemmus lemmus]